MFNEKNEEILWEENCNELINLLDYSNINQRIMIAELNRNLGNFEKCITVINSIDSNDYNWIKEKFVTECNKKNRWVIEMS